MSRSIIASEAASHPPLSGIDEVSVAANAVLKFEHPTLDPLYIHSGASAIKWAYHLNTQSTPTIGGEVIQVLSAMVGPLTITGQTAGLKTNATGKIDTSKEVHGWRDVGQRVAYSPYQELREIIAWFRSYMTKAGALTAGQQLRDEAAIKFTYAERGWQFYIQVTKLAGFRYDMATISPEWSITAEIVSDNALDYFGGVTMGSFTDDLITNQQLLGQMGLSAFGNSRTEKANPNFGQDGDFGSNNPFLNPAFSASGTDAAKIMGDNFKGLVAAWATGDFAHFGFGALLDNGFDSKQVDATYQSLFGTTFSGSQPGAGSTTAGTTTYGGPANPQTKDQIILDIVTTFEAISIPGKVAIAVVLDESHVDPNARQPDGDFAMGLFQTFPTGAGGTYSRAALTNAINNKQDPVTKYYPTGQQISDAASWFSATQKKDYPAGLMNASDQTLAEFAARAQGHGSDGYDQKILNLLGQATAAITAAAKANVSGGTASGVRLAIVQWAYKLVAQYNKTGKPSYNEPLANRNVESITAGDWSRVPYLDCSDAVALLYCWGSNNNKAYALNSGTYNGTNTHTIWSTWERKIIALALARAGDLINFGTTAADSFHVAMFMEDYHGDSTQVFSFGSNPPSIGPFSTHKASTNFKVFNILP